VPNHNHTRHSSSRLFPAAARLALIGAAALAVLAARPARAADDAAGIDKLCKQALEAFDGLNFDQAKTLLEQAISDGEAAGLQKDPAVARAHLDLGMLFIAAFQKRDDAMEHFKAALTIQPGITAPAGLFNPEVQAAFDEAKESLEADQKEAASNRASASRRPAARRGSKTTVAVEAKQGEGGGEEEEADGAAGGGGAFYLGLGLGSGGGIARGQLDTNKDLIQNNKIDNSWSGGFATSRLGHLTLDAGYFVSRDLLVTLEGRLQFVSGTSDVTNSQGCPTTCSAPSTGIAVLAKGTLYFAPDGLRPFIQGGLGGGTIRQVVQLNVMPMADGTTFCGKSGKETCVDTVTGGPFLIAAGGGVAYQMGSLALIGSLVSNIGIPHFMLNFDITLGVGMRL
jgi:hypothetical protein